MSKSELLFRVVRLPLLAYLLLCLLMTFIETWLVYPIPPVSRADWNPTDLGHKDVWFESDDGTRLHGWLVEHPEPEHVVLYYHGNGAQVADNAQLMTLLREQLDATVMVFDYRGYGKSEGKPHEAGVIADGMAAQRWIAQHAGIDADEVVLIGRSIGGGVAIASAAELGAKALVLQSTFASMVDTAAMHYPWLPVRTLMRNRYDSLSRIANYEGPVLQSHGTDDRVVLHEQGKQLFEAIPSTEKEFITHEGGMHNTPQPPGYYEKLREFLAP